MVFELDIRSIQASRRSFPPRWDRAIIAGKLTVKKCRCAIEERVNANICRKNIPSLMYVVKRIKDLSYSGLVSLKVYYELHPIA